MTACLRCDGCNKAVTEHEEDISSWWRLTRYGADWIEEPGAPRMQMPMVQMHSVFYTGNMGDMMPVEDDDEDATEDFVAFDDEPGMAIVHFCSSECLAQWASQAAALEP